MSGDGDVPRNLLTSDLETSSDQTDSTPNNPESRTETGQVEFHQVRDLKLRSTVLEIFLLKRGNFSGQFASNSFISLCSMNLLLN